MGVPELEGSEVGEGPAEVDRFIGPGSPRQVLGDAVYQESRSHQQLQDDEQARAPPGAAGETDQGTDPTQQRARSKEESRPGSKMIEGSPRKLLSQGPGCRFTAVDSGHQIQIQVRRPEEERQGNQSGQTDSNADPGDPALASGVDPPWILGCGLGQGHHVPRWGAP